MRLFLTFFLICLASYAYSLETVEEVCQWGAKRTELIKQLTPYGQTVVTRILKDLQYISGAAIQPVFEFVKKQNNETVNRLLNSTDAGKFGTLLNYYGVGNYTSGSGNLRDVCQDAKNVETIIKSFTPANRQLVIPLVEAVHQGFNMIFPVVISINRLLDYRLYDQLESENQAVLEALANLYLS